MIVRTFLKQFFFILLINGLFFAKIQAQIADKVFKNAKIYTTNNTFQQAIAILNGNIIYVGTDAGVAAHIGGTTVVQDLGGRLMLPGLHDVHTHPLEAGSDIGGNCILSNSQTNPEAFVSVLQGCNLTPNSNGWITASGHSIFALLTPNPALTRAPKAILDQVFPTTPVAIMEKTSHSVWVNSAALTALGITSSTPDPVGGHIVKWNGTTEPSGVLLDNAGDAVLIAAFASNATTDAQNKSGLINTGLPTLAQNGITSICEARTYWKRNYQTIWQSIKAENKLTCRVVLNPWVYPNDNDATLVPALQALYSTGDDMLKSTQIKVYADGIVINATAAFEAPYTSNFGLPFTTGLNYVNQTRLTSLITTLEQTGYDFHIHAIGDRGITEAINAIAAARAANPTLTPRHRITHLEFVKPSDYTRFQPLNITTDMQVAGDFTQPANWGENNFLLGAARTANFVPLKSLFDAGARVTLSSDWDVSTVNPFVGMQNALTRSPQQLPSVEEVVKAYTINAAYVMRQEAKAGTLEVGKWADLIVTDKDIFTVPTNQINTTKVLLTLVGGKEVYRSTILPVEMLYFEVKKSDCAVTLEWATASEKNNAKFVIERSEEGDYFEPIGEIKGKTTSHDKVVYTFNDDKPFGKSYYRLRQISLDGKEDLSPVVTAQKRCKSELDVQLLPNIASSETLIQLVGGSQDEVQVDLLSAQGSLLKQFKVVHNQELTQSPIDVSAFAEGVYYLRIYSLKNKLTVTKPLVISR